MARKKKEAPPPLALIKADCALRVGPDVIQTTACGNGLGKVLFVSGGHSVLLWGHIEDVHRTVAGALKELQEAWADRQSENDQRNELPPDWEPRLDEGSD